MGMWDVRDHSSRTRLRCFGEREDLVCTSTSRTVTMGLASSCADKTHDTHMRTHARTHARTHTTDFTQPNQTNAHTYTQTHMRRHKDAHLQRRKTHNDQHKSTVLFIPRHTKWVS